MQVADLDGFLEHLSHGLLKLESSAKLTQNLADLRETLRPFSEQRVSDFCSFLSRCAEYERTGTIPGKVSRKKAPESDADKVAEALYRIRDALERIRSDDVTFASLADLAKAVERLRQPEVLTVARELGVLGAARTKKKALENIREFLQNQKQAANSTRF